MGIIDNELWRRPLKRHTQSSRTQFIISMLDKFINDPKENTFDLQTIVTQHSTGQDIVKCTSTSKCQSKK